MIPACGPQTWVGVIIDAADDGAGDGGAGDDDADVGDGGGGAGDDDGDDGDDCHRFLSECWGWRWQ